MSVVMIRVEDRPGGFVSVPMYRPKGGGRDMISSNTDRVDMITCFAS